MEPLHAVVLTVSLFVLTFFNPGANLFVVVQTSLASGRRAGVLTGLGVALGDAIYSGLGLFGMATLITQCEEIFSLIKIVGGAYLLWFAWNSIRHQATPHMPTLQQPIHQYFLGHAQRGNPDMGKTDGLGRHRALVRHLAHLPEPGLFPTGGTPRLRADSAHCQQGDWRDHWRVRPQADLRRREPPLASSRAAT